MITRNRTGYIDYMNANSISGAIVMLKLVFLIPNLYRFENDDLPHGSYRNRGAYARYMRNRNYKKYKKKVWKINTILQM